MATNDGQEQSTARLHIEYVLGSTTHKTQELVGFGTLFEDLLIPGKVARDPDTEILLRFSD